MTFIIAKIFSIYFIVLGLALLINGGQFRQIYDDMLKNRGMMIYGAVLALFVGAFIVSTHNIWVMGWPVIITILGWWIVFKGFALLLFPDKFIGFFKPMMEGSDRFYQVIGITSLLLGALMAYHSWLAF